MPVANVELNARQEMQDQPIVWRLSQLFNVVTNIHRARVTEDYAYLSLGMEGTADEIAQATAYLRALGVLAGGSGGADTLPASPEEGIARTSTIYVRLSTVNPQQGHSPLLYRIGKDYGVVVNIERAAFDDEEGGFLEVTISGPLNQVQRAIAYMHTTGLHVNPRQRSVTDYSNL